MTVAVDSHSRRAVDFQRLLLATERNVQSGPVATLGPSDRLYQLELNRLNVFLRCLREQLTELHSFDLGHIPSKILQGYSFRVDALERILLARQQELRRFKASAAAASSREVNLKASGAIRPRTPGGMTGGSPAVGVGGGDRPGPSALSSIPDRRREGPGGRRRGGGGEEEEGGRPMDREDQETVDREKAAQEVLQAQLEELVGALKASSTMVHTSLREQNRVLEKTEDAAQKNLEGLQTELKKTEEQLRRSWSNSLTSFVMILMMLGIFALTFLFMRVFPKRRWLLW